MSFTQYFAAIEIVLFIFLLFGVYSINRKVNRFKRAMADWVDSELKTIQDEIERTNNWKTAICDELQTSSHDLDELISEKLPDIWNKFENIGTSTEDMLRRVENLEKGIVPDFEQAKAAAQAVDNFNAGLSGILGFDPIETARRQRKERNAEG